MTIKTNTYGHYINTDRYIPLIARIIYKNQKDRQRAFEDNIIELNKFRDKEGIAYHMPQLNELVNIYMQAEE